MQSETIRLSIIIPCHNHGRYLPETLGSVFRSDFIDYEVIIINDGSTDPLTIGVLKHLEATLADSRCRILHHETNLGLAAARNTGIENAQGSYILPLDSDDRIDPRYLSKAVAVLDRNPEVGVVYPNVRLFGEQTDVWRFPRFDARRLLLANFIIAASVYRKTLWETCGGYDPGLKVGYEDWEFWIRVMKKGWLFYLIDEIMLDYRVRKDSMRLECDVPEKRRHVISYICKKHKDVYIDNLAYVITEKDLELLAARQQYTKLEQQHRRLAEELGRIHESRGWRLLQYFYRLRRKIDAPHLVTPPTPTRID